MASYVPAFKGEFCLKISSCQYEMQNVVRVLSITNALCAWKIHDNSEWVQGTEQMRSCRKVPMHYDTDTCATGCCRPTTCSACLYGMQVFAQDDLCCHKILTNQITMKFYVLQLEVLTPAIVSGM